MSDVTTIKLDSKIRKHTTLFGDFGVIESKALTSMIGDTVVEVKVKKQTISEK